MWYFIGVMLILIIIVNLISKKIIIRFDTFFRKGFKKYKDKYRYFLFRAVSREMVNRTRVLILLMKFVVLKRLLLINLNMLN